MDKIIAAAKSHAEAEFPRESCGLIVKSGKKPKYIPCTNMASGNDDFAIGAREYADAEDIGEIIGVVHSHPQQSADASEVDLRSCEAMGVQFHIISVIDGIAGEWKTYEPSGWVSPLVGRQFYHGKQDCYTLVQDYYKRERGIDLIDFHRDDCWWDNGENLYLEGFEKAGFTELRNDESIDVGDVILMQVRSLVPNHAAIYLGESLLKENQDSHIVKNSMIHHLYGRLSTRDVYGGMWVDATRLVIRYRG